MSLVDQVASGIRQAIASGWYKPGEILPTRMEFADALGVSERIPREAVARLAAEGIVYTRRCLGCVVADKGERHWLGRVLFVDSDDYLSYYYTALFSSFQRTLSGAGYLVSRVTCPVGKGGAAVERLNEAMGQHFDLIVLPFHDKAIVAAVERSGSRYLIATKAGFSRPGCVECFEVDCEQALSDLLDHCEKAGVKTIEQVGVKGANEFLDLRQHAVYRKMSVTNWGISRQPGKHGVDGGTYGAMLAFAERLKFGKDKLPDLFFFRDDFLARGAIVALLEAQVKVPEDVRIVTLSNRGNSPVFPKSLARIEVDPILNGRVLAEHTLTHLAPSARHRTESVGYRYIRGKTFAM